MFAFISDQKNARALSIYIENYFESSSIETKIFDVFSMQNVNANWKVLFQNILL